MLIAAINIFWRHGVMGANPRAGPILGDHGARQFVVGQGGVE